MGLLIRHNFTNKHCLAGGKTLTAEPAVSPTLGQPANPSPVQLSAAAGALHPGTALTCQACLHPPRTVRCSRQAPALRREDKSSPTAAPPPPPPWPQALAPGSTSGAPQCARCWTSAGDQRTRPTGTCGACRGVGRRNFELGSSLPCVALGPASGAHAAPGAASGSSLTCHVTVRTPCLVSPHLLSRPAFGQVNSFNLHFGFLALSCQGLLGRVHHTPLSRPAQKPRARAGTSPRLCPRPRGSPRTQRPRVPSRGRQPRLCDSPCLNRHVTFKGIKMKTPFVFTSH